MNVVKDVRGVQVKETAVSITPKTPIKYWGGKQQLAPKILQLIPSHKCYVEPFFGGGAVFFLKPQSKVEIINDINDNMVNFYRVVKKDFPKLIDEIELTLYSEYQWKQARDLWKRASLEDDEVRRAWAVFLLSWRSFSGNMGGTWAFSDQRDCAKTWDNMKKMFDERYVLRLENVQIACRDALNIIKNTEHEDTFYFLDPPYYNSNMGHYDGYSLNDFKNLLEMLGKIKGKFLLTTYPSEILSEYTARFDWKTIENKMHLSASNTVGKNKVEVFTMNY